MDDDDQFFEDGEFGRQKSINISLPSQEQFLNEGSAFQSPKLVIMAEAINKTVDTANDTLNTLDAPNQTFDDQPQVKNDD